MKTDLQALKLAVENWAEQASQNKLLGADFVREVQQFSADTPASLFATPERPLVVGFFGGTGVGKSTLLNRLAGEDVARTGVERPTSREVTLYLHSTVHVEHLPKEYPVEQVKTAFHNNDSNRDILWIDMPDFDSAESANRKLVNDWLPHIDMLVYVVSPERYRDDNGWRLLLEHGGKHAWVFVINHWDRGIPAQREDFRSLLSDAGLEDPHLFCTDSGPAPEADEFELLRTLVQSMSTANTVAQLEAHGVLIRLTELRNLLDRGITGLGTQQQFEQTKKYWDEFWVEESKELLSSLHWKYPLLSARYSSKEDGIVKALWQKMNGRGTQSTTPPSPATSAATPMSDTAAMTLALFEKDQVANIEDDVNEIVQIATQNQLPALAVRSALHKVTGELDSRLNQSVTQARDTALANPGSAAQRSLAKIFSWLSSILPLMAIGWAGYRIVNAFYEGGSQPAQYLGSNFAINAALLIGLSWLLPFLLARKIKPSLPRVATSGMQQGAMQALDMVQSDVHAALEDIGKQTQQTITSAEALFAELPDIAAEPVPRDLQRVLM